MSLWRCACMDGLYCSGLKCAACSTASDHLFGTVMEVNPYYTALDDLAARTDVLRGYL